MSGLKPGPIQRLRFSEELFLEVGGVGGRLTIAAIRSGADAVGDLPEAAFHRTLEMQLGCPKCDVSYNLVVDWERATSRFFEEEARGPIRMLRKAIQMGHGGGHRVTHYETSGVVVRSFVKGAVS